MKSIAVMQPYFFPYIGYFQLMSAVDLFVALDDVQYTKRGWINRNRVLLNGSIVTITLPVINGPYHQKIMDKTIHEPEINLARLLAKIRNYYHAAPFLDETMTLIAPLFSTPTIGLADFNVGSLMVVGAALGINTPVVRASSRGYRGDLVGENRLIHICESEAASRYVNAIRAREIGLYDAGRFKAAGISLQYIKSDPDIAYTQASGSFVGSMSIIDVMMNIPREQIRKLLTRYELIS